MVTCAAGFALLQLTNPARTNPPVINDMVAASAPPTHITAMLHAACYDCHSSETRWPWYSHVAPMSWLIVSDVREGRDRLNLSEWPTDAKRAARRLENMSSEISSGDMPLVKYTKMHADARLTEAQRKELAEWLDGEAVRVEWK
ncbi:MAG TPA: heme-binding domain-containing protein [Verrucomicrobiae bacterium]|nr:heme-binding domain-containing protein [Verrucomicrobiae bacterium]